jgi:NitT/TauT family transport system permease protein
MRPGWRAAVLPILLIIIAEAAARAGGPSDSVAPPSAVAVAFVEALHDGSILNATRDTLISAFAGLAIGATIGLVLGVLFGGLRKLDRLMESAVELLRPIPSVAVLPIALVALGFGYRLEIAIVAYACVWPLLIFTRAAVAGVEPGLLDIARILQLGLLARVFKIIVPAALPRIFVAFRLAAGVALIVAVTVEIAVNPLGLGAGIMTAGQALRPDLMLAYLVWIGLVGYLLNSALVLAQHRLFGRAAQIEAAT